MASKVVKATRNRTDELVSFLATAVFIGGGYYVWRASRKADVLEVDASEARPTRHMVDLAQRLDRDKLAKWLDVNDKEDQSSELDSKR